MMQVGVTGCGEMGCAHVRAYLNNQIRVAAVCDVDQAKAEELAAFAGCRCYSSLEAMLSGETIEALSVCTPPFDHLRAVKAAARYGCAVLCEKPFVLEHREIPEAVQAVERAGVPFRIGFKMRYEGAYREALEALRRGEVGKAQIVAISHFQPVAPRLWKMKAGIVKELLVHACDMACCIFRCFPKAVSLQSDSLIDRFQGDDRAVLQLDFGGGKKAVLLGGYMEGFSVERLAQNDFAFQIVGERGSLSGIRGSQVSLSNNEGFRTWTPDTSKTAFDYEILEFIQAAQGKSGDGPAIREAVASQIIIDTACEHNRQGWVPLEIPGEYRDLFRGWL